MKFKYLFTLLFCLLVVTTSYAQAPTDGAGLDEFVKAEGLRKSRKFNEALVEYDNAIKKNPKNYQFHYKKALCEILLKKPEAALKGFEKTVELKKDFVPAYSKMAKLYQKDKEYEKAINAYENAYKYDTEAKNKLDYKLSILHLIVYRQDKIEEAGNHINDAKQLAPNDLKVLYYDAKYNNSIGKYEAAKQAMLKAIPMLESNSPKDVARFYFELGYAYHHLEDYEKKDEAFEKAKFGPFLKPIIKLSPEYYHAIALSYYRIYELDKCKELVETALQMRKDFQRAHELLVKVAATNINKATVIEHQKNSIETERDPTKRAFKYDELSVLELESGRYEDAIKSVDEALKINPKNYGVVFTKAVALHKLGKTKEAIAHLTDLLKFQGLDPESKAQYSFAIGIFYSSIGDKEKAQAFLEKAKYGSFKYAALEEIDLLKDEKTLLNDGNKADEGDIDVDDED